MTDIEWSPDGRMGAGREGGDRKEGWRAGREDGGRKERKGGRKEATVPAQRAAQKPLGVSVLLGLSGDMEATI